MELESNQSIEGTEGNEDVSDVIPTVVDPSISVMSSNNVVQPVNILGVVFDYPNLPTSKLLEMLSIIYSLFNEYQVNRYKDDLLIDPSISFDIYAFINQIEQIKSWLVSFNKAIQDSKDLLNNAFTITADQMNAKINEANIIIANTSIIKFNRSKADIKITGFGKLVPNEVKLRQVEKQIELAKAAVLNAFNVRDIDVMKGQLSRIPPFEISQSRDVATWPIEFIDERTKQFKVLLEMSIVINSLKWIVSTIETQQSLPSVDVIIRHLDSMVKSILQIKSRLDKVMTHAIFKLTYDEYQILLFEYVKSILTLDDINTPRVNLLYRLIMSHSCADSLQLIVNYLPSGLVRQEIVERSDESYLQRIKGILGQQVIRDYNDIIIGLYATMKEQIELMKKGHSKLIELLPYNVIIGPLGEYVVAFLNHSLQLESMKNDPQFKHQSSRLTQNFEIKLKDTEFGILLMNYEKEQFRVLNAISHLEMRPQNVFVIRENAYYKLEHFRNELKRVDMIEVGHAIDLHPDDDESDKMKLIKLNIEVDIIDNGINTLPQYDLYSGNDIVETGLVSDRSFKKLLEFPGDKDGDYFMKITYTKNNIPHTIKSSTISIKVINTCLRCGIHYREFNNKNTACRWSYNEREQKSLEKVVDFTDISLYTFNFLIKYLKDHNNNFEKRRNTSYTMGPYYIVLDNIKKMENIASQVDHLRNLVNNLKTKFSTFFEDVLRKSVKSQSTFDTTLNEPSPYYTEILAIYENDYTANIFSNSSPQTFLFNMISHDDIVKLINEPNEGVNQIYNKMILINKKLLNNKYSEGDIESICLKFYRGLKINKPNMDIFTDFDSYISSSVTYHENKLANNNLIRNNLGYKYIGRHSNKQRRPDTYKIKLSIYVQTKDGDHVLIGSHEIEPNDDISRQFKNAILANTLTAFMNNFLHLNEDFTKLISPGYLYFKFDPILGSILDGRVGKESTQSIMSRLIDKFIKSLEHYEDHLRKVAFDKDKFTELTELLTNATQGSNIFSADYSEGLILAHKINQFLLYGPTDNLV